jgi:hypothetical protein
MASTFRIRLLSLELQSTREPKPYHDRIVTSLVVSVGGKPVTSADIPPGQDGKHAYCAFVGAGTVLDFTAFQPGWGHPLALDFVLQDDAPETIIRVLVHVANWRGLPDKIIEKALLAMGVATATATAGLAAEALTTAGKWGVTLAAALGGEGLKELIEGFALEVPKCRGTVFVKEFVFTSSDLYGMKYETTSLPDGTTTTGIFLDSASSDPMQDIPEKGCGQPKAKLNFAIEKTTIGSFAPGQPIQFGRRPETQASIDAWTGQWSDSPWNLSRVFVVIERGSAADADVLKVSIRESIGNWGGEIVVNLTADNLPVTLGTHMKYWGDVFAQLNPLAPLLPFNGKLKGLMVNGNGPTKSAMMSRAIASGSETGLAVVAVKPGLAILSEPDVAAHHHNGGPANPLGLADSFDPAIPVLGASVQSAIAAYYPVGTFLEKALTVSLPEQGITLALYAVVAIGASGMATTVGHAVRYSRVANMWATQTDVMLTRYAPEKIN